MNKKRQTVWLVSMLSIMVVLSAYYLFTDDLSEMDMAANQHADMDTVVFDMLNEVDTENQIEGEVEGEVAGTPNLNPLAVMGEDNQISDTDVIEEYEAQAASASGTFIQMDMARNDALSQQHEAISDRIDNPELSDEEVMAALTEMQELEAMTQTIDSLEGQLMFNYGYENALIEQVEGEWLINIQAEELQNTEVVSILDLVMGELNVKAEDVTVIKH